jgi:hypothetical protein
MTVPLADVAWWAPLAIVGGALGGAAVGYLVFVALGPAGRRSGPSRTAYERTDTTSYSSWNPMAFLVAGAIVAVIAGLAIGLSLA